MKSGILIFIGGVVVGAGVLSLINGVSEEALGTKENTAQSSTQQVRVVDRESGATSALRQRRQSGEGQKGASAVEELLERVAILRSPSNFDMNPLEVGRISNLIGQMSADEVDEFLRELEILEENDDLWEDPLEEFSSVAMLRLFELDGFAALRDLAEGKYPNLLDRYGDEIGIDGMSIWTSQDPDGVRDWVLAALKKFEAGGSNSPMEEFLEDEEVGEAFMFNYERQRPGQSLALVDEFSNQEVREALTKLSLKARINLAEAPGQIQNALNESLDLSSDNAQEVVDSAVRKDFETSKRWVADQEESEVRNTALLRVGAELFNLNANPKEEDIAWFLDQDITDAKMRMQRLTMVQSKLHRPTRTNADFISSVDFVTIPGIPANPEVVIGNVSSEGVDITTTRNSIEAILNNPLRTSKPLSEQLREAAAQSFDGRFVERIEQEILELGLE